MTRNQLGDHYKIEYINIYGFVFINITSKYDISYV